MESLDGGRGRAGGAGVKAWSVGASELANAAPHSGQKRLVGGISARQARHGIGTAIVVHDRGLVAALATSAVSEATQASHAAPSDVTAASCVDVTAIPTRTWRRRHIA